jgi:undecaprenyl diphosphate synthase
MSSVEAILDLNKIPNHVAIIMDGNGRWAKANRVSRKKGHEAGSQAFLEVVKRMIEYNIKFISMFAWSTENWGRPKNEVASLMELSKEFISNNLELIHENNIKVNHLGNLHNLPADLQEKINESISLTKNNTGATINIAFDYGGKQDIVSAVKKIIAEGILEENINEEVISNNLATANIPDPDLIIRPGGEKRISNFLIWQAAYAEYYFTNTLWPDFNAKEIDRALEEFNNRDRRFGLTS